METVTVTAIKRKERGGGMSSTKKYGDEITIIKLRDQIAELGNSLSDSETRRANLLEDFQRERQQYILQYKQMSDM